MSGPAVSAQPRSKHFDAVVHAVGAIGHRRSYVDALVQTLDYSPLIAPLDTALVRKLMRADKLALATFDDAPAAYALIALWRGLMGRKTAALFLRPQTCMRTDQMKFRLKKLFYRIVRLIPGIKLVTITPHKWKPELGQVSHVGTYDPQYWDFHDGFALRPPQNSAFSREISEIGDARSIICLPGFLSREKGFELFTQITAALGRARVPVLLVAAGTVLPGMEATAETFKRAGGMLVDRELHDDEIASLYGISSATWACYVPEYDQASGIFGRAFQTGTPVLVRRGSLIETAAQDLGAESLALPFDDVEQSAEAIIAWVARQRFEDLSVLNPGELMARVAALREHFVHTVRSALGE